MYKKHIVGVAYDVADGRTKDQELPPPAVASVLSAPRCASVSQPVVGACAPRSAAAPAADAGSAPTAPYWPTGGAGSPVSEWTHREC